MSSRRPRAVRSIGHALISVGRYLGLLLWDTLVYLWRLLADLVSGMRFVWRRWQLRRRPEAAGEFETWRGSLRECRTARWAPWHALTLTRRLEVRAAATALALVAFVVARSWWLAPGVGSTDRPTDIAASAVTGTPGPADVKQPAASRAAKPGDDAAAALAAARKASAAFASERQRVESGQWAVVREASILEPGRLGDWDDFGLGSPFVMKDGAGFRMWYRGCRMSMREYVCGIGHATSQDGVVWDRASAPVFTPADPLVREGLDEIVVAKAGGGYFLWYSVMANPVHGRKRAAVHLATSPDGLTWKDEGRVLDGANDHTVFIFHSVFHDGQTFHLWYATKVPDDSSPVLHHFSSSDGKGWTSLGGTRTADLDSRPSVAMGRLIIVAVAGGEFFALFTHDPGSQASKVLGALRSPDGTNWTATAIDSDPLTTWSKQHLSVASLSAAFDRDGLWLWAALRPENGPTRIGVAFRKGASS